MNNLRPVEIVKYLFLILFSFMFSMCMHDEYDFNKLDDEIEINAGVLTPIAYGSLNLKDIVTEFDSTSQISTDADGLLFITYEDSLFSYFSDELLNIPQQDYLEFFIKSDFTVLPGFPGWNTGDTLDLFRTENFPFNFIQEEKLDSMILDQGSLIFNVTSEFQHTGNIIITCPNIRLNNVSFIDTIVLNDDSGNFSSNSTFPIDGYTIYLNDSVGNDTMFFPIYFHVELISSGGAINYGEEINVTTTLSDLDFEAVFGYLGNYELLDQTGSMDLSFFDNTLDGYLQFENPQINFNIRNSYGVPAAITIERFTGFKTEDDSIQMNFNASIDPFGYAFPKLSDYINSDIFRDTTIVIDSSNSNISDFLTLLPSRIEYNLLAISNPITPGIPIDSANFATDDSKIDIDFEFIIPLWFKADNFALEDTIDLDLTDIDDDADFIEKVNIMLEVSNGLPLDIDFQIYFLDETYNSVDTLFAEDARPVISSGVLDPSTGKVLYPGTKTSMVEYTKEEITNLNTVRYAIIRAGLKTPPDSNGDLYAVKFFTDYVVNFNISVGVDVKANSNDF